ncbi:hypothetical protein V9T40_008998 [Parthenolecanium corni]|uniref:Uncharacterized protein n=1 Tax=Parthenolecanium corni TaxID=536013 RepID=A0AAN9TPN1_9HEMI
MPIYGTTNQIRLSDLIDPSHQSDLDDQVHVSDAITDQTNLPDDGYWINGALTGSNSKIYYLPNVGFVSNNTI